MKKTLLFLIVVTALFLGNTNELNATEPQAKVSRSIFKIKNNYGHQDKVI